MLTESRFSCVAAHPEAYILYFDSGKKRGLTVAGQGVFSQDKPVDQKNLEINKGLPQWTDLLESLVLIYCSWTLIRSGC